MRDFVGARPHAAGAREDPSGAVEDDEQVGADAGLVVLGDGLDGRRVIGRRGAHELGQVGDHRALQDEIGELGA